MDIKLENKELIELAYKAREFSYSPYSNFKVGAALLTEEGKVFLGTNIENSSYGACICAERTAAVKAISEGYTKFLKIAIVSDRNKITFPCGICRQFLCEFNDDLEIILDDNGDAKVYKLSDLLKYSFKKEDLFERREFEL